ncbi:MAG TPA: nucleotidyltransferase domain-containing protein [Candidatus Nanoarchaeia archaeon]|nr:nucleotidyltransferase domain-containing protein [Candidatus Nanoarchaeia archaeon]
MLEIFNSLQPFFEDVLREISVREYARMQKVSPPTASSLLKRFSKEGVLLQREERNLLLFRANKESSLFKDLAVAYWRNTLKKAFEPLREHLLYKKMVLFGSIAKVENTIDSDVDIFIDIKYKELNVSPIERRLKRRIQFHFIDSLGNEHLKKNIENGVIL